MDQPVNPFQSKWINPSTHFSQKWINSSTHFSQKWINPSTHFSQNGSTRQPILVKNGSTCQPISGKNRCDPRAILDPIFYFVPCIREYPNSVNSSCVAGAVAGDVTCAVGAGADADAAKVRAAAVLTADVAGLVAGAVAGDVTCAVDLASVDADAAKVRAASVPVSADVTGSVAGAVAGDVTCAVDCAGADADAAKVRVAAVSVSAEVAGLVAGAVAGDVTCAVDGAGADADAAKVSVPPSCKGRGAVGSVPVGAGGDTVCVPVCAGGDTVGVAPVFAGCESVCNVPPYCEDSICGVPPSCGGGTTVCGVPPSCKGRDSMCSAPVCAGGSAVCVAPVFAGGEGVCSAPPSCKGRDAVCRGAGGDTVCVVPVCAGGDTVCVAPVFAGGESVYSVPPSCEGRDAVCSVPVGAGGDTVCAVPVCAGGESVCVVPVSAGGETVCNVPPSCEGGDFMCGVPPSCEGGATVCGVPPSRKGGDSACSVPVGAGGDTVCAVPACAVGGNSECSAPPSCKGRDSVCGGRCEAGKTRVKHGALLVPAVHAPSLRADAPIWSPAAKAARVLGVPPACVGGAVALPPACAEGSIVGCVAPACVGGATVRGVPPVKAEGETVCGVSFSSAGVDTVGVLPPVCAGSDTGGGVPPASVGGEVGEAFMCAGAIPAPGDASALVGAGGGAVPVAAVCAGADSGVSGVPSVSACAEASPAPGAAAGESPAAHNGVRVYSSEFGCGIWTEKGSRAHLRWLREGSPAPRAPSGWVEWEGGYRRIKATHVAARPAPGVAPVSVEGPPAPDTICSVPPDADAVPAGQDIVCGVPPACVGGAAARGVTPAFAGGGAVCGAPPACAGGDPVRGAPVCAGGEIMCSVPPSCEEGDSVINVPVCAGGGTVCVAPMCAGVAPAPGAAPVCAGAGGGAVPVAAVRGVAAATTSAGAAWHVPSAVAAGGREGTVWAVCGARVRPLCGKCLLPLRKRPLCGMCQRRVWHATDRMARVIPMRPLCGKCLLPLGKGTGATDGPTDRRGVGEAPPPPSVGTLSGGAVTSELAVPVSTGTPVVLVPPGRATTSAGVGVGKELLHQHPHTAGTVVAAGESPAKGEYGWGGGAGVVVGGALAVDTHAPCLRVFQHAHTAKPPACTLHHVGRPADSESAGETAVSPHASGRGFDTDTVDSTHARANPARGYPPVGGHSSPLLMGGENSGKVVNKLQSLVILSRARGVDRRSLETAHQPNPCPMELPLEVMHCGQGAGEAQHLNDAAFRLCHTPRGDQYPHHSHSYEGGGVVGAVPNKTNLTRSRVKQVEKFPLGATSPGVRHPLEEADPHLTPVVDGSLTDHTLAGDEDQPLEVATSGSNHIHWGDQPLCLVEPPGGKLWQKGQIVRTVNVVGKEEDPLVVAASTSAVRNTYAIVTARLLAEFDCRGEAGAFWVKEVPLETDAPRLHCAGCGNSTLFFCSGCKVDSVLLKVVPEQRVEVLNIILTTVKTVAGNSSTSRGRSTATLWKLLGLPP